MGAMPPPLVLAESCCEMFNLFLFFRTSDNFAKLIVFLLNLRFNYAPSIELPNFIYPAVLASPLKALESCAPMREVRLEPRY